MLTILYNSKDGGSVPYTVALSDYQVTNNGQLNLVGRLEYACDKPHLLHMFEALANVFLNGYPLTNALAEARKNAKSLSQSPANYQYGALTPVATPVANTPNGNSPDAKLQALDTRLTSLEGTVNKQATTIASHDYTVSTLRGTNIVDRVRSLESQVTGLNVTTKNLSQEVAALNTPARPAPQALPAMQPVYGSTLINARGYNPISKTLTVQFLDGNTYNYFDVPQNVYANFVNAGSPGGYYNANIKGRFVSQQLVKY